MEWENIALNTKRLKVPGGYLILYHSFGSNEEGNALAECAAMCFVPNPPSDHTIN